MTVAKSLDGNWPAICALLVWKQIGHEILLSKKHMRDLPEDRVLMYETEGHVTRFKWMTIAQSKKLAAAKKLAAGGKAVVGVEQLQGRWQKIAVVLLWQRYRDGVTLSVREVDDLPADQIMLTHSHGDVVEFRYVASAEAAFIQKWEKENEGRSVVEKVQ